MLLFFPSMEVSYSLYNTQRPTEQLASENIVVLKELVRCRHKTNVIL